MIYSAKSGSEGSGRSVGTKSRVWFSYEKGEANRPSRGLVSNSSLSRPSRFLIKLKLCAVERVPETSTAQGILLKQYSTMGFETSIGMD